MSCYILNFSAVASITDGFANTSWAVAYQNDRRTRKCFFNVRSLVKDFFLMSFEVDKEGEKTAKSQLTMPFLPKKTTLCRTDRKNVYRLYIFMLSLGYKLLYSGLLKFYGVKVMVPRRIELEELYGC